MDRYRILRNIASGWIAIFLVCLVLCGCEEHAPEPPPKPKEVRKKIIARPGPPKSETIAAADVSASDQSPEQKQAPEQKTGTPGPEKAAQPTPSQPVSVPKDDEQQETDVSKTETAETAQSGTGEGELSDEALPSDIPDTGEVDESLAAISGMDAEDADKFTASYSPKGKADPFEPLLREEPKKTEKPPEPKDEAVSSKPKPPPRRLTPLERLDLGQLKLVGIIRAESGNKALVEEASGKGYIIVKGTYIGIHSGIVVDILQDRVVVEEQDEDVLGKVTVRKRELKFNRPEGEDYYEM